MIKIDPAENPTIWYNYEDDEKYCIRWVNPAKIASMTDADLIDYIIVNWEGVLDGNGKPLPCKREYKLLFLETVDGYKRALRLIREAANINNFLDIEGELKNSNGLSVGTSISQKPA